MMLSVSGRTLTVAVEGKAAERFDLDGNSTVQTPRGMVSAIVAGDVRTGFTITKRGPSEGEVVTETRELSADGKELKVTFSHRVGEAEPVVVSRVYVRAP